MNHVIESWVGETENELPGSGVAIERASHNEPRIEPNFQEGRGDS